MIAPIETIDPEFGELLLNIISSNKISGCPKICIQNEKIYQNSGNGWNTIANLNELPDRNDPCLCGSDKKFKKCCG